MEPSRRGNLGIRKHLAQNFPDNQRRVDREASASGTFIPWEKKDWDEK